MRQQQSIGGQRFEVTVVGDLEALGRYAEQWDRLAAEAPRPAPMLSCAWVSAFLEHRVPEGQTWKCAFATDGDGNLLGVLPFLISTSKGWLFEHTVLRAPRDEHTGTGDLLVAEGREDEVAPALLRAALGSCRGPRYIEFDRIPENFGTLAAFEGGTSLPFPVTNEFRSVGAFLQVGDDFDGYRAGLSGNFRSNLNKAARKLEQLDGVSFEFLQGADAGPEHLSRFMRVEDASWKGREGTAIARSQELISFYETLTRHLAEAGWLQWHFLEADGKTIAGNLAIECGDTIVVWKLGYDEAYRKCSPGSLLFEALVRTATASRQCSEINLMTDMPWYDNWQMEKRRYFRLRVYPRRPAALLTAYLPRALALFAREIPGLRPAVRRVRGWLRSEAQA